MYHVFKTYITADIAWFYLVALFLEVGLIVGVTFTLRKTYTFHLHHYVICMCFVSLLCY
jgi:hypothetical protein